MHPDGDLKPLDGPDERSILVVVGTRPEMIKLEPIVAHLGDAAVIAITGQHYDDVLIHRRFNDLSVHTHTIDRTIGSMARAQQLAIGIDSASSAIERLRPTCVVVHGDTNSTLAGGLAANATGTPLVHVEAGLRSFDRRMPEEHNRVLVDHMADLLLAPTTLNRSNLLREGLPERAIRVTGNSVVDAVRRHMPSQKSRAEVLAARGLEADGFILATLHRPENVDSDDRLRDLLELLDAAAFPVILTVHPRWRPRLPEDIHAYPNVTTIDPIEYHEFMALFMESAGVVTDSGGVQEEATVIKKPTIVIRRSTERPEAIGSFTTLATSIDVAREALASWEGGTEPLQTGLRSLQSPYGAPGASRRCAAAIADFTLSLGGTST